ncbi:MAG: ribosomal protein S18-alanine N-acetyltransferase [Ilumatobacteraceae bacterium]
MSVVSRLLRTEFSLVIEPMRRRHIRAALAIEEQCHPKPWTAGVFASEIDLARHGERYYAVARMGTDVVGYAGLMFAPDEAHITNIAVDPARRGRGYGRTLLIHVIEFAIAAGFSALTLEVRVSNLAAQNLYRQFGFAPAGVRQRYYENSEDALVMWAHDIQGAEFAERLAQAREREVVE